jgi:hypothetical protein
MRVLSEVGWWAGDDAVLQPGNNRRNAGNHGSEAGQAATTDVLGCSGQATALQITLQAAFPTPE